MVDRQTVKIADQSILIRPTVAVRQKSGQWVIHAEVTFDVKVGPGRTVRGKQLVKMTRGSLVVAPDMYRISDRRRKPPGGVA